ncbi:MULTISPECIES: SymE family type I addiction module toxin [Enterobacter]|uniref:Type I toxin-antitoxin system SymE family toxin n=1 Tax=Enterobacter mori TaxID=539813 RepID=A0A9Q7K6R0_9ENTR|nr:MULTISPECIES: SymE family type I addiction module toxin [Enterobacter]KAA1061695.1 type I toxin-antitoxin system SymE family toxin [Enterobacter mori]MBA7751918.1 type I toxin-antitoxin system SymE family toxin [Enterobacter sp. RHBSTW-01064]MBS0865102.1 type I toxin-antitoxin system SymE family toxin [Enterobacter mori]MCC8229429.1 type I toxin-antitoxin system SymE family toxin [Enterobacter mori]MCC8238816.1 type I toxin-antitoxin system SymE family toxin [Enterobacter mori]
MSVVNVNKKKVSQWLKTFPAALNDLCDVPVIKQDNLHLKDKIPVFHPRAETPEDSSACCELYSRVDCRYLPLSGKWLANAGFINGMPVKIRVMKDCIVITPQHTRELWGCLEGMSVVNINKKKVAQWLKTFPGALNDLGDVPVIKRDK